MGIHGLNDLNDLHGPMRRQSETKASMECHRRLWITFLGIAPAECELVEGAVWA
jgi:hypothetical protein